MKRRDILIAAILVLVGLQFLAYCSSPLDTEIQAINRQPGGTRTITDTLFIVDTVVLTDSTIQIDTIIVIDTLFVPDTVVVTDTVFDVDTVIVYLPDTSGVKMICGRLGPCRKKIVWLFRNPEGDYRLEFSAAAKSYHPSRCLSVNIDGTESKWNLKESLEYVTEQHLSENAAIVIQSKRPLCYGHTIDICLTVTPL